MEHWPAKRLANIIDLLGARVAFLDGVELVRGTCIGLRIPQTWHLRVSASKIRVRRRKYEGTESEKSLTQKKSLKDL